MLQHLRRLSRLQGGMRLLWVCCALCLCGAAIAGLGFYSWKAAFPISSHDEGTAKTESGAAPGTEGELRFSQDRVDLGLIKGETTYAFEFENTGSCDVRITKISPSCNCTLSKLEKEVYKPGERGNIRLEMKLRTDQVARKTSAIDIEYDGAAPRTQRLLLTVQYRPDVLAPAEVVVHCPGSKPGSSAFTLVSFLDHPLEVEGVTCSTKDLMVSCGEKPSTYTGGWQQRFEVQFEPGHRPTGVYAETITIRTANPEWSSIQINATINVESRIRLVPDRLYVSANDAKGQYSLFVSDRQGEPLEIESVSASAEWLQCTILPGEGDGVKLRVTVDPHQIPKQRKQEELRVHLKKPVMEVIPIKVFVGSSSVADSP